jgi:hypothetical protein
MKSNFKKKSLRVACAFAAFAVLPYSLAISSSKFEEKTTLNRRKVMPKKIIVCLISLAVSISLQSMPAFAASLPEAKPDKGLVVFYRLKRAKGAAIRFQITESGGVSTGTLTNGSMFYKYYQPGQKIFDVSTPSVAGSDLITLDIVAGKTYFLRGEILWGWPAGRPKFSQEQESRALQDVGKL